MLSALVRRSVAHLGAAVALLLAVGCNGNNVGDVTGAARLGSGDLAISISGLPDGVPAGVTVTGASTYAVTSARTLRALSAGNWTITAIAVTSNNVTYVPQVTTQTVVIENNGTSSVVVNYMAQSPTTGFVTVTVSGLPSGALGSVMVTSPTGTNQVTATTTITGSPGAWTLTALPVQANGFTYTPSVPTMTGVLSAGGTLFFDVQYVVTSGALSIDVTGIPGGSTASIHVVGAHAFDRTVTTSGSSQLITDLAPGAYVVTASSFVANGVTYAPTPATQTVEVNSSLSATHASIVYASEVATLVIGIVTPPPFGTDLVTVSCIGGFARTVSVTTIISDLPTSACTATPKAVSNALATYAPSPLAQQRTLAKGARDSVGFSWTLSTGSIAVVVAGLPAGASGDVSITGPGEFHETVTATRTITNLVPGTYGVQASSVTVAGVTYTATPSSQSVDVATSLTAAPVLVTYAAQVATLVVTIDAPLVSGTPVTVTGPNGFVRSIGTTTTFADVAVGTYSINSAPVTNALGTFVPTPSTAQRTLAPNSNETIAISYAIATGSVNLNVLGLPPGVSAAIALTGPAGTQTLTASQTVVNLPPAGYTVAASPVTSNGVTYLPTPTNQHVEISASLVPTLATITYSANVATLIVGLIDLPAGASNVTTVTGPNGFTRTISATTTLTGLAPGVYTVTSNPVTNISGTYAAAPQSVQRTLVTGVRDSVGVTWSLATGSIALVVSGVPAGAGGNVTITGPNAFTRTVATTQTLTHLAPGSYTVTAAPIVSSNITFAPTPSTQTVNVIVGLTASPATVSYATSTGAVSITVNGLPVNVSGSGVFSGNGVNRVITSTTVITALAPGSYTLTAAPVSGSDGAYNPNVASQVVNVVLGTTTPVTLTYSEAISSNDLRVDFAYVTQAVQRPDGSVPLVAGRPALLRVFVTNNRANSLTPRVRARIYNSTSNTPVQDVQLSAPEASVRTSIAEDNLNSTWNLLLPASSVTTNLRVLVEVDPSNQVEEADDANNVWPRGGIPQPIDVRVVPDFNVRFVPVSIGGLTGRVTASNTNTFLTTLRLIYPILGVNVTTRATYTSTAAPLQANDANGSWTTVLRELLTLQKAEGPATTHYYGVVQVTYTSGVAGFGYISDRAAMGWDWGFNSLNGGSNDAVAAHEFGHNFSRPHSPCGGAAGTDPSYPYPNGIIGTVGWNATTGTIIPTTATDIMGYCPNQWVSDWTWTKIFNFRQTSGAIASASPASSTAGDGLLVWGSVVDGRVILEPAFRVNAPPTPLTGRGTQRIEALDRRGQVLASTFIEAEKVDHVLDHDERHFAVVLPWSAQLERSIASIRVRDSRSPFAAAVRTSLRSTAVSADTPPVLPAPDDTVESPRADRMRVRWNALAYPMAMVRDAQTGEILAYLRKPGDELQTTQRLIDIIYSDGVRSTHHTVRR